MHHPTPPMSAERLAFQVSPAIIRTLIENESSTVIRAVAEAVMNSVDAGASVIDIDWTGWQKEDDAKRTPIPAVLTVRDDGRGISSKAEIERHFQTLGFDHQTPEEQARGRSFGAFGLGRMQLFAFGAVTWRTHGFQLHVDLQSGLDFEVQSGLSHAPGMSVSVRLKWSAMDETYNLKSSLETHLKYLGVPVRLNGEPLNIGTSLTRWDHEDDQALYALSGTSQVALYNLGVFVGYFRAADFGSGGVICTRTPLKLNISRNVTVHEDAAWAGIKATMNALAARRLEGMLKMSETDVALAVDRTLMGEFSVERARELQIAQDVTGKLYTVEQLIRAASRSNAVGLTPHIGDAVHDRIHQQSLALVLHPDTLNRLNVPDLAGVRSRLARLSAWVNAPNADALRHVQFHDDLCAAVLPEDEHYFLPDDSTLSRSHQLLLQAAQAAQWVLTQAADFQVKPRKIVIGDSPHADGWTNGTSYIAVERRMLKPPEQQADALVALCALLAHELCHSGRSDGSHVHDAQFYARYHDLTSTHGFSLMPGEIERGWREALIKDGEPVPHTLMPRTETTDTKYGKVRSLHSFELLSRTESYHCVRDVRWPRGLWLVTDPRGGGEPVLFWQGHPLPAKGAVVRTEHMQVEFTQHAPSPAARHAQVWVKATASVATPLFEQFQAINARRVARKASKVARYADAPL